MVLIVDDDPVYWELICDRLQAVAIKTLCALNGQHGLDLFNLHQAEIDLVCLDFQVPGLNGSEPLLRLRMLDQKVPVILCTAGDLQAVQQLCRYDKAVYFYEKLSGLGEFIATVRTAIQKTHPSSTP